MGKERSHYERSLAMWRKAIEHFRAQHPGADFIDEAAKLLIEADPEFTPNVFESFQLDPEKPAHRGFMLAVLTEPMFSKRGRPEKWSKEKDAELVDLVNLVRLRDPGMSVRKATEFLARKVYTEDNVTGAALRKRVTATRRQSRKLRAED